MRGCGLWRSSKPPAQQRQQECAAKPRLLEYVPNINNIKNSLSNLTGKVKNGSASSNEVDGTSNMFSQLKNGTGFTPPANVSLPGLS